MLKIVVFDSGYGGELFADYLENELPVAEVIRVIDWRNSNLILKGKRRARRVAFEALRPYIGKVDLIVFANQLLGMTSLGFFRRKFRTQKFLGFKLKRPDSFVKKNVLVFTTKAVAKTISFRCYLYRLKRKTKVVLVDDWIEKIDDGELKIEEIKRTLEVSLDGFLPEDVVLGVSQLSDIKPLLKNALGKSVKIYDSFSDTLRMTYKTLRIRGGLRKQKR